MSQNSGSVRSYNWRVVDILVASVLGVACGLVFAMWNQIGYAWYEAANALTPGLGGIATGGWLIGATLGGLVIRKPGAAIYVELIAAITSVALGSQWSLSTLYSGLAQGIGAEIVFALLFYRSFGILAGMAAGVGAAAVEWCYEGVSGNFSKGVTYNAIYFGTMVVSGALIAGLCMVLVARALAATGALDRFAIGRERQKLV